MKLDIYADGREDWKEFLETIPQELMDCALLVQYPAKSFICLRSGPVDRIHILLQGKAAAQNTTTDGKAATWINLASPIFIGDLEMLAGKSLYASDVMAITDCVLAYWPIPKFMDFAMKNPPLLLLVARVLARTDYGLSTRRGQTVFRSNLERTAIYLHRYCKSVPQPPNDIYIVKMTRSKIASEVFFSQKTLDRCLRRLQETGVLSIVHGKVHITKEQMSLLEKFRDTPDFI